MALYMYVFRYCACLGHVTARYSCTSAEQGVYVHQDLLLACLVIYSLLPAAALALLVNGLELDPESVRYFLVAVPLFSH